MSIIGNAKLKLKKQLCATRWRKLNKHNFTEMDAIVDLNRIYVGKATYGTLHIITFGNRTSNLRIGHYCSIAGEVKFILDGEHALDLFSSYPFKSRICLGGGEAETKGDIIIDDDVWIGERCTILSGVHIGQGAVIGAGSIVAKNVPPYAIYAGGRIIRFRFSQEVIDKLLLVDFEKLNYNDIIDNESFLYEKIDNFLNTTLYKNLCHEG